MFFLNLKIQLAFSCESLRFVSLGFTIQQQFPFFPSILSLNVSFALCKFPIFIFSFDLSSSIFGVCARWLLPSMKYYPNFYLFLYFFFLFHVLH